MALTNASKPTTTLANTAKAISYESWATIVTTWASETRTWDEMLSNWDGFTRPTTTFTNIAKPA